MDTKATSVSLAIDAPAKLNLYFEVLHRRPDGYHVIESLVTPISMFDSVEARAAESLRLRVEIPDRAKFSALFEDGTIPEDERNLAFRAARLLQEIVYERSGNLPGAHIILQKRIPAQAGLGGGSSDAAATLVLLNELWQVGLTREALATLGARLGCDVPLFLRDFPVVCRDLGNELDIVPNGAALGKLHFVVVKPARGLSTPAVYRACTPRDTIREETQTVEEPGISALLKYWRAGDLDGVGQCLFNRLTAPARALEPEVARVLELLRALPCSPSGETCAGSAMTGSGSACFALCRSEAHAAWVADWISKCSTDFVFQASSMVEPLSYRRFYSNKESLP